MSSGIDNAEAPIANEASRTTLIGRAAFLIGSAGLLLSMLLDAAAVLGLHLGIPLLGSIELVQACIVLLAASAVAFTTLERAHASVHIFSERLAPGPRGLLERFSNLLGALFFAALCGGSIWIAAELAREHEATELLGLPIAPLRALWCISTGLTVLIFLAAMRGRQEEKPDAE